MRLHNYLFIAILALSAVSANAAPVLFDNVMSFDNNAFGLVDFDADDQDSATKVSNYLSSYNATAVFEGGSIITGNGYAQDISPLNVFYGTNTSFIVTFNNPVNAAGMFLLGMQGGSNPYANGVGCYITVWLANGAGTHQYNYTELLAASPSSGYVTGFFGVFEQDNGIEKIEVRWNRDAAGIDSFYFSDTITTVSNGGPHNVLFSQIPNIQLPVLGVAAPTIPEPLTIVLLISCFAGLYKRFI